MNFLNLTLSPLQKLQRLKELLQLIDAHPTIPGLSHCDSALSDLLSARDQLLATIGSPPLELLGNPDPATWSATFAGTFPNIDAETAQAWFANAMLASYQAGQIEGFEGGKAAAREALGMPELVATLQLIMAGLDRGAIRAQLTVDAAAPAGTKPRKLEDVIVAALAQAGVIA